MSEIVKRHTSELATYSPENLQVLKSLSVTDQKLIKAALAPKVVELPGETVEGQIATIITTVITIAGQQADPATVFIYAGEFYERVLEEYPNISIEEIKAALRAGVYGEYGKYYGLNPKTFYDFVKAYLFSEQRLAARDEFEGKRFQLAYKVDLTPEQRRDNSIDFCEVLYKDYLAENLISDFIPTFIYDFLEEEKLIFLTLDEKKVIQEMARSYYLRFKTSPKTKVTARSVKDVMLTPNFANDEEERTVSNYSKKFSVFQYFEKCKAEGKEIIFEPQKLLK